MKTTQRHQAMCLCGHARSFTFQGNRSVCREPSCHCVHHDTAVADKTAVVDTSDLRSDIIDRTRLMDINRRQWAAIRVAKVLLSRALEADSTMFHIHASAALSALRGIGDE